LKETLTVLELTYSAGKLLLQTNVPRYARETLNAMRLRITKAGAGLKMGCPQRDHCQEPYRE
jgi:hypothetical protein